MVFFTKFKTKEYKRAQYKVLGKSNLIKTTKTETGLKKPINKFQSADNKERTSKTKKTYMYIGADSKAPKTNTRPKNKNFVVLRMLVVILPKSGFDLNPIQSSLNTLHTYLER